MNNVAACLSKVRKGNQEAARELVEYLQPMVTKIVRARRPWRAAEEDLIQEVYKKVFVRLKQYKKEVPFHHWVSRIAVSTCIDALRYQRRRPEYRWADISETEVETIQSNLCDESSKNNKNNSIDFEIVRALIAKLKPADQLAIRLFYLEHKSGNEIAKLTGWTESSVKVKVFRARRRLRDLLIENNIFLENHP
jgi:RNA polymerase sigma-70 factor (ECF subfamily)